MDEKVVIEIELDDGTIKKGFTTINREGKASGKKVGKSLEDSTEKGLSDGGSKGLSFLSKTLIGGVGAVLGAAFSASKFIDAAKIQEDAVNSLNSSLIATGQFTEAASRDFQEYASSLQQQTKFGDEAILQNAALIQSLGNLSKDGLKEATKTTLDLAAALKIDLTTASTLVGKAAAGNVSSFSRYGVAIKTGANNAETFSNALTALNSKFGGAAQRELGTFSGTTQQLSNSFGDLLEEIGFIITRSPVFIGFIKQTESAIKTVSNIITANSGTIRGFLDSTFGTIGTIFSTIKGLFSTFADEIGLVVAAFVSFQAAGVAFSILAGLPAILGAAKLAVIGFGTSLTGLSFSFNAAKIAAVAFQGAATLGIGILLSQLVEFILETRDRLGGWANLLSSIAINARIAFLSVTQSVINATDTIVSRLSILNNLPFGLGDKFSAFSDKIQDTSKNLGEEIASARIELENIGKATTVATEEIVVANSRVVASNDDVEASLKRRADAEKSLFSLRQSLGGLDNELIVIAETERQKNEILETARQENLLKEEEFLALRQDIRDQATAQEQLARDAAITNQEVSLGNFHQNFLAALRAQGSAAKVTFGDIAKLALNTLGKGLGNAFKSMGAAFRKGESTLGAFKTAFLGIISELASSFGDYFIKKGIALSLDPLGGFVFGGPLIAAGVGLKALSGFLGASGGGTQSATASTGGSFGSDSVGFGDNSLDADPELEREGVGNSVNLVVNGDIFDSRDTSRRLSTLLTEAFDDEDISINEGAFA